jgi:hypothetical protein
MNATIWNPITSQADIERLLNLFGGFHDSCLREAHVWTEHYVDSDLSMNCPGNLDTRVRLLIQRQFKEPSAIELLFEQVITFHVLPSAENYASIIFNAAILREDEIFYWADRNDWMPKNSNRYDATWVAAKKLSWRDASNWMGKQLRYGAKDFQPEI